jgi:hypothetical protein
MLYFLCMDSLCIVHEKNVYGLDHVCVPVCVSVRLSAYVFKFRFTKLIFIKFNKNTCVTTEV